MNRFFYPLLFLALLASGCGFASQSLDTPRELSEAGYEAMQSGKYDKAVKLYEKLKDRFPFSPYTVSAELSLADAYFLGKKYAMATEAYKKFLRRDLQRRGWAKPQQHGNAEVQC